MNRLRTTLRRCSCCQQRPRLLPSPQRPKAIRRRAWRRSRRSRRSLPANGDPLGTRRWLAERGVTFGFVHTVDALSNVQRRHQARHGGRRQARSDRRHRLRPAGRARRPQLLFQQFSTARRQRTRPQSGRQSQHDQQHRGPADDAAVRDMARATVLGRQGEPACRPARRRYRVPVQPVLQLLHVERLADQPCRQHSERRRRPIRSPRRACG